MNTDELTQVVTAHQQAIARHDQYESRVDRIEAILETVAQSQQRTEAQQEMNKLIVI